MGTDTGYVIHVRLTEEQHKALKRYATNHQRPISQALKVLMWNQLKQELKINESK